MYMEEIASNGLKENLKVFWSYIKSKRQESTGVAPLNNKDGFWERSGSVVECLTRDRRAAGSSLTGVTALWSLSETHLS